MSCPFAQQQSSRSSRSRYTAAASPVQQSCSVSRSSQGGRSAIQRSQSYSQSAAAGQQNFQSQVEQAVIAAKQPLSVQERDQITAGPYRGIHLNKQEEQQFNGPLPIAQYKINDDPNPEVIKKRLDKLKYQQEVSVKYLQPPSPPKPGDLIIKERQGQVPPAPPVVLRQEACPVKTPEPLIMREQPPKRPPCVPQQVVEVEGTPVPPPARRVVLEKLTSLPPKPQNVIIEKWLPYKQQRRRVVYQRSCGQAPPNPRNLVIEWEAPDVEVEKVCKDLGVESADPEDYVRRYGSELKQAHEIPNPCGCGPAPRPATPPCQRSATPAPCGCPAPRSPTPAPAPAPCGCPAPRAATPVRPATPPCQQQRSPTPAPLPTPAPAPSCGQPQCGGGSQSRAGSAVPELEGDVAALKLVDLEKHGLGAYRRYIQ